MSGILKLLLDFQITIFLNFFKFFYLFLYLFLDALGLHCYAWAFFSCGKRGLLFIAVRVLLIAAASLIAEQGLQARGLSSCGAGA